MLVQGPIYAESGGGHDERRLSPDMERRIDAEVHKIVREAYQRAIDLLVGLQLSCFCSILVVRDLDLLAGLLYDMPPESCHVVKGST